MKKIILSLMAAGLAGLLVSASAQPAPEENNTNTAPATDQPVPPPDMQNAPDNGGPPDVPPDNAPPPDTTATAAPEANQVRAPLVITPSQSKAAPRAVVQSEFLPPSQATGTNNPDELRLNFRNAPLEMVLNYLSDAAGFIIVLDTPVRGTVNVISSHPVTRNEAVDLLNSVLNQNGYAAIRDGRTLTIVDKNDAKTRDIPVKTGNNPDAIPDNDEIVTQIIPIRFVEARQLVSDLSSFVSPQATVVANEAGNSIVVTDTQSNIRHLMEIIQAVDNSAETETEIRVFPLKYASPTDVATEISSVFPSSTSGSGTQAPTRFGGRGGGGPGGFFQRMMAAQNTGNSSDDRIKKATQVTAVADTRIQAVIVTAPKDLIEQIASMMKELDVPSDRDQDVYVFQTKNGDPQQMVSVLQSMFQSSSTSRGSGTSSSQNSALQQRANNNTTTSSSTGTSSSGIGGNRAGGAGGVGGRSF